ncbi:hypothetical protein T03_4094 [Trichinella britovi]|uniref:Uncharacterized protein n=1 Tax=Trichinella britovi TaxID=45882 RepID=A0A0V1CPV7_TRIBR|nr:hypothetical protein T03_4094 [Trichinella britovi]
MQKIFLLGCICMMQMLPRNYLLGDSFTIANLQKWNKCFFIRQQAITVPVAATNAHLEHILLSATAALTHALHAAINFNY